MAFNEQGSRESERQTDKQTGEQIDKCLFNFRG